MRVSPLKYWRLHPGGAFALNCLSAVSRTCTNLNRRERFPASPACLAFFQACTPNALMSSNLSTQYADVQGPKSTCDTLMMYQVSTGTVFAAAGAVPTKVAAEVV